MHLRFVRLRVRPQKTGVLQEVYERRVVPALRETAGCFVAGLFEDDIHPGACLSFTLWRSHAEEKAYEKSGLFESLIYENEVSFSDSFEWKLQLSEDLTLEYLPIKAKPEVELIMITGIPPESFSWAQGSLYLRVVSVPVQPGQFTLFEKAYENEIIPALREVDGCRQAYLGRSATDGNIRSVTFWEDREAALAYEQSGRFARLTESVLPMLSSLYRRKIELNATFEGDVATSEDLTVAGYQLLTGTAL